MNTHPVLTIAVDGISFAVTFDRWDSGQTDRARWIHAITTTDGELIHYGDDLTTVPNHEHAGMEAEALAALLTFAGADIDRAEHERRTGRTDGDGPMFGTFADVVSFDADDLAMLAGAIRPEMDR